MRVCADAQCDIRRYHRANAIPPPWLVIVRGTKTTAADAGEDGGAGVSKARELGARLGWHSEINCRLSEPIMLPASRFDYTPAPRPK